MHVALFKEFNMSFISGFKICNELDIPAIRVFHLPGYTTVDSVNLEAIMEHVEAGNKLDVFGSNYLSMCLLRLFMIGYAIALLLDTSVKGQMGMYYHIL